MSIQKILLILWLQVLILGLVACGGNDDPKYAGTFKVARTELSFPASQGESQIYVESSSRPNAGCDVAWLHLGKAELNGESTCVWIIEVVADGNKTTESRTAAITIEADGQKALVNVEQAGATPDEPVDMDDPDIADYILPEIPFPTDDNIGETAQQAVKNIFVGWNIGNSMEVPDGETAWGNPAITQKLIDGVKASGFNAVRIPCAWNAHLVADTEPYTVDPAWMARVHEVVDYAYKNGLYVIINTHWDGGWLELHANADDSPNVVKKEKAIWTQIANEFIGYGQRLIFAGNNEVRNKVGDNENWGLPTDEERAALETYNQVFVDAVRATGGKNAQRNLVVQSWCCNPWRALDALSMPSNAAQSHLMAEVHFYDPMDFTHTDKKLLSWGYRKGYYTADNDNQEDYIDNLFALLKAAFVDKGYPLVLGEYGTVCHSLTDKTIKKSDYYYLEYVTKAAKENGIAPFYWDNGRPQTGTFGIINRTTGAVAVPHMFNGIMKGACGGNYPF